MRKILYFYLFDTRFIVEFEVFSDYYIEVNSLFPIANIKAEFFDENGEFLDEKSIEGIRLFCFSIVLPYLMLCKEQKQVKDLINPYDLWGTKKGILNYVTKNSHKKYFSSNYLKGLKSNIDDFLVTGSLDLIKNFEKFENYSSSKLFDLEKNILEDENKDIYFSNFEHDTIEKLSMNIELDKNDYQFNFLIKCLDVFYSNPNNNVDECNVIRSVFSSFSEQRKLSLFHKMTNNKLGTEVFNGFLQRWWNARY